MSTYGLRHINSYYVGRLSKKCIQNQRVTGVKQNKIFKNGTLLQSKLKQAKMMFDLLIRDAAEHG